MQKDSIKYWQTEFENTLNKGCRLVLWKSVWWFLRKLGIKLLQDTATPLLGMYPKDAPSYYKDSCSAMFKAALFGIARTRKQPRCPSTKEWIMKVWHIYTLEYYSAVKITMTS